MAMEFLTTEEALELALNRLHQIRRMCLIGFPTLFFIWIFTKFQTRRRR